MPFLLNSLDMTQGSSPVSGSRSPLGAPSVIKITSFLMDDSSLSYEKQKMCVMKERSYLHWSAIEHRELRAKHRLKQ
jgi:hypothetical protein